jgi:hypothetical protein
MKANSLMMTLVVGLLAASPAYAFPSGTHGQNYYQSHPRLTASQARPEVQVAVMAQSTSQPVDTVAEVKALCPTVSIWYGTGHSVRATHSH